MITKVYMPHDIYQGIFDLTQRKNETSGILLYRRPDSCGEIFVAACYLLGEGSSTTVSTDSRRVNAINNFLGRNPDFTYTAFHTHTESTIGKHGEHFRKHFSRQDIEEMQGASETRPNYSHILFTPDYYTGYPRDDYEIEVTDWEEDDGRFYGETNSKIMNELRNLEKMLGITDPVPIVQFY